MTNSSSPDLDRILAELNDPDLSAATLPPVDCWDPPLSGDIAIRIASNGQWFHEGDAFRRQALVKLFSSILKKEGEQYFLVTPTEKWRIQVDDVPFVVTRLETLSIDGQQTLVFYTPVGDRVVAGSEHPIRLETSRTGEVRPYLLIRSGMEGLLARSVYYHLAELAETGTDKEKAVHGVYSLGLFFPLE